MTEVLTKDSAWQEVLRLTSVDNVGWEDDERVLKRLKELRPYYSQDDVRSRKGSGRTEGCKRSIPVRLTDKDGNSTIYPSKVSASKALGLRCGAIAQTMKNKSFSGYVMGYKVEEVLNDV